MGAPSILARSRSGLALVLTLGILGVLSVLGVAFVILARLERKASQQRLNGTRALLLARSGIEDAWARLDAGQDPDVPLNRYAGEDRNLNGVLDAGVETQAQVHRRTFLDTWTCPVRLALRPSFFARALPALPVLSAWQPVAGRPRGYSGSLSGPVPSPEGAYALKVIPDDGFFLNGGDPAVVSNPAAVSDVNTDLRRMLGILAEALDREAGAADGNPVGRIDGERLVDQRPALGWQDFVQVRDLALGGSQAKLDVLKPYLSLTGRPDLKVIRSTARVAYVDRAVQSWGDIKLGRYWGAVAPPPRGIPDFERIGGRVVGRAPVRLAWARTRRPVLTALIGGLKGLYLDESTAKGGMDLPGNDKVGTLRVAEIPLDWAPGSEMNSVVNWIYTSPAAAMDTWEQWNGWMDGMGPYMTGNAGMVEAKCSLLKSNFNPNSDLNKFNPNRSIWRPVDKSDFLQGSTEFSLEPSGSFEVSSAGRVTGAAGGGGILAERVLTATLPGVRTSRLTTQKEFVCEDLGDLDTAGDEGDFRCPGAGAFLTPNRGLGKCWGHRLDLSAKYPGTWMDGSAAAPGASLQSYPEPYRDTRLGGGLGILPADYDGSLQLATLEAADGALYSANTGVPPPPLAQMRMLARFDDGMDLDSWTGGAGKDAVQRDAALLPTSGLDRSLLDPATPSTLYPDGAYSELRRSPAYLDQGNLDGFHGCLSFWVKPNYSYLGDGSTAWRGRQYVQATNFDQARTDQFFFVGEMNSSGAPGLPPASWGTTGLRTCMFEIGHFPPVAGEDTNREHRASRTGAVQAHRWTCWGVWWDFRCPNTTDLVHVWVDGAVGNPDGYETQNGTTTNNAVEAKDLTLDDVVSGTGVPHQICLGRQWLRLPPQTGNRIERNLYSNIGGGADATFDEFAAYDFGGAPPGGVPGVPPGSLLAASRLCWGRYQEGRYYRESAYLGLDAPAAANKAAAWTSAPIRLPSGARLRQVDWTWYRPFGMFREFAEIELADASGSAYLWGAADSRSTGGGVWPAARQSWFLGGRPVPQAFRLRAVFRRSGADPSSIVDGPVLDDLTLVYSAPGPGLLSWRDGE